MDLWSTFPPDIRVRREASYLTSNAHEVTIVCSGSSDQQNRETVDGIDVIRVPKLKQPFRSLNYFGRHLTLLDPQRYQHLSQVVHEKDPDILHSHDLYTVRTGLWVARRQGVPVVADLHELYPESLDAWRRDDEPITKLMRPHRFLQPSWRYKRLEKKILHRVDGVVTVSPEQLEYYRDDYDLSEVETGVVRNVPDLDRLRQMPVEELDYEGFVVGYVGGFTPQRGLETAIKSFSELLDTVPDATLLMVGDSSDDYINDLKKLTEELGIEENVEFTGWIEFERAMSYTGACDVSLCPIVDDNVDSECGLANKLFQSMFMGTPVIVSDLRAMRNVVEETDCGLVFEQESVSSLTEALMKLHKNPELRREMGENGKHAVKKKYNFRNEGGTLINLYEKVKDGG